MIYCFQLLVSDPTCADTPGADLRCGKAVQVDPMKPTLKPLGNLRTTRLILGYDEPPSDFAFKFNLRHYTATKLKESREWFEAGAYTRPLLSSS